MWDGAKTVLTGTIKALNTCIRKQERTKSMSPFILKKLQKIKK